MSPKTIALYHGLYNILSYLQAFFGIEPPLSLSDLASKILMSKITSAYNGLTAVMVVLVTESP
jgi:hypothetical protein